MVLAYFWTDYVMDEKQLESQSRLLIELGEPEAWLETMLRAARRSATHADDIGDRVLAGRWRNLARSLEYAAAAAAPDPMTAGEPSDSAIQSQGPIPSGPQATADTSTTEGQQAIAMPPPGQNQSPAGLKDTSAIIEAHRP